MIRFGVGIYLGVQTATITAYSLSVTRQPDVGFVEAPHLSAPHLLQPFFRMPDLDSTGTLNSVNSLIHSSSSSFVR